METSFMTDDGDEHSQLDIKERFQNIRNLKDLEDQKLEMKLKMYDDVVEELLDDTSEKLMHLERGRKRIDDLMKQRFSEHIRLIELERKRVEVLSNKAILEERMKNELEKTKLDALLSQQEKLLATTSKEKAKLVKHQRKREMIKNELEQRVKQRVLEKEKLDEMNRLLDDLRRKELAFLFDVTHTLDEQQPEAEIYSSDDLLTDDVRQREHSNNPLEHGPEHHPNWHSTGKLPGIDGYTPIGSNNQNRNFLKYPNVYFDGVSSNLYDHNDANTNHLNQHFPEHNNSSNDISENNRVNFTHENSGFDREDHDSREDIHHQYADEFLQHDYDVSQTRFNAHDSYPYEVNSRGEDTHLGPDSHIGNSQNAKTRPPHDSHSADLQNPNASPIHDSHSANDRNPKTPLSLNQHESKDQHQRNRFDTNSNLYSSSKSSQNGHLKDHNKPKVKTDSQNGKISRPAEVAYFVNQIPMNWISNRNDLQYYNYSNGHRLRLLPPAPHGRGRSENVYYTNRFKDNSAFGYQNYEVQDPYSDFYFPNDYYPFQY